MLLKNKTKPNSNSIDVRHTYVRVYIIRLKLELFFIRKERLK